MGRLKRREHKTLTEKLKNSEFVVFSDFAENGTLANFGSFRGGTLGYKTSIAGFSVIQNR